MTRLNQGCHVHQRVWPLSVVVDFLTHSFIANWQQQGRLQKIHTVFFDRNTFRVRIQIEACRCVPRGPFQAGVLGSVISTCTIMLGYFQMVVTCLPQQSLWSQVWGEKMEIHPESKSNSHVRSWRTSKWCKSLILKRTLSLRKSRTSASILPLF